MILWIRLINVYVHIYILDIERCCRNCYRYIYIDKYIRIDSFFPTLLSNRLRHWRRPMFMKAWPLNHVFLTSWPPTMSYSLPMLHSEQSYIMTVARSAPSHQEGPRDIDRCRLHYCKWSGGGCVLMRRRWWIARAHGQLSWRPGSL